MRLAELLCVCFWRWVASAAVIESANAQTTTAPIWRSVMSWTPGLLRGYAKTAAITKCYVRAAGTFAIDMRDRRSIDSMFIVSSFRDLHFLFNRDAGFRTRTRSKRKIAKVELL